MRVHPALRYAPHHCRAHDDGPSGGRRGCGGVLIAGALTVAGVSGAFGRPAGGQQAQTTAYVISRVERALSAPGMNQVIAYTRTVYPAGITLQPAPGGLHRSGGPGASSPRRGEYELLWANLHTTKLSAFTATR